MHEELESDAARLAEGSDSWIRWWRMTGERELRCILMTAWDPVGTGDAAEGWDEYDSYIPGIVSRLRDASDPSAAASEVAAYLNHIEDRFIGHLPDRRARANHFISEALVAWHEWSYDRGGRPPQEWIDDA